MRNYCTLFLLFFLSFQGLIAQELIPRETFFTGEKRFGFKSDPKGEYLYFRTDTDPNSLFFIKTANPTNIHKHIFRGRIRQFEPTTHGLLTIWTDDQFHIHFNGKALTRPENVSAVSIIGHFPQKQKLALEIETDMPQTSGIYALHLKSGKLKKIYDKQPMSSLFLDQDLKLVAGNARNQQSGNSFFFYKNKEWLPIEEHAWDFNMFLGGFSKVIAVSPDGQTIYYTSNKHSDKARLYAFDVGHEHAEEIAHNEQVDILPFGHSTTTQGDLTSVVGLFAQTFRHVIAPDCEADFEWLSKAIKGDISFAQSLDNDQKWLIREFTGGPMKVHLFDRTTRELTYLLSDYPILDDLSLASRHPFTVITRDSLSLPIHVYLPPGSDANQDGIPDTPLPTVLYVHGGPWVGVVHWNQQFHWRNFQLLTNRGYAVINCEFRGGTGLGREYVEKSIKTWGSNMTHDKTDIAQWAVHQGIAQKGKVGIWGWSYGGYAAMAGIAFAPETYACAVAMYGISDLESFGKIPFTNTDFWKRMVGDAYDSTEAKMLAQYSPINYINEIKAPLLLTTGSKDERVPQEQMDQMAKAMEEAGKDVIYFYYPEEVHDYRDPNSWISFWAITEQFLQDYIGGKAQPIQGDFEKGNTVTVIGEPYIPTTK